MSVADYFKIKCDVKLKNPAGECVDVGKPGRPVGTLNHSKKKKPLIAAQLHVSSQLYQSSCAGSSMVNRTVVPSQASRHLACSKLPAALPLPMHDR